MLERKRWDLNGRDSRGDTPLIWAVRYRNDGMVALFLEQEDIEPNQPNRDGRTAFSLAAEWGNEGAVKLLLQHGGADSNSPDNRGQTPLSYAASGGHEVVVKLISDRTEFNPNSSPRNSRALPSYTPRYGYLRALGLLLGYENPASGSSGTHRPPGASVHGGVVPGQWVARPPPALEDVTPNTAIDLALDASLSRSVPSRPPRELPLQLKQSPLNQLDSPSAVCTPGAPGSGVGFLFFLLVSIMLFALAFRVFLVYSGYGDPYELFHTLNGAWRR
ncbi:ankyrin [Tuber magnatum]|uniref:Ankyrin n=1 Tax=Tuber magnatum TaxID=42249 RepID=A0A317T2M4_9PEZI|nr:ankyrin [Tuber magnatum]